MKSNCTFSTTIIPLRLSATVSQKKSNKHLEIINSVVLKAFHEEIRHKTTVYVSQNRLITTTTNDQDNFYLFIREIIHRAYNSISTVVLKWVGSGK